MLITAYAGANRTESKPCPKYDGRLQTQESSPDGTFTLSIPPANTSYLVTYCLTAYDAFTTEANDNRRNGSSIQPAPVRLWQVGGDAAAMSAAITHVRNDARKTIASLSRNHAAFAAALEALEAPEKVLVTHWMPVSGSSDSLPSDPLPAQDLSQLTQSVRTTLAYFDKASPQHFREAVKRFDEIDDYLRKRENQAPQDACSPAGPSELRDDETGDGKGFALRIFFGGLIAFLSSLDGAELTVVMIHTPNGYTLSDGTALAHHRPLLLARAATCQGACRTDDPESIARFFYPNKTLAQACLSLGGALLGGSAWQLSGAELSLEGPKGTLQIRTGARGRHENGALYRVPLTAAEREDFSWVADISELAPETEGYDKSLIASGNPGNRVAARLRLRSGKVVTYSVIRIDAKARPVHFRSASGEGTNAPYAQALANWVEATIHVPGDSLRIVEQSFTDPARKRTMQLYPRNGVMEIALLNFPPIEMPSPEETDSKPGPRRPFEIYYDLVKTPPAHAERLVPFLLPPSALDPQTDWSTLHPLEELWSDLLDQLGLSPRGKGPYGTGLFPITKD